MVVFGLDRRVKLLLVKDDVEEAHSSAGTVPLTAKNVLNAKNVMVVTVPVHAKKIVRGEPSKDPALCVCCASSEFCAKASQGSLG